MWARAGGVAAHPENAYRLLRDERQLALVFPEGTKGTGKLYNERYQLRRFGRGGFVEIAMRAGVPVVPIAVVGSEEAMPMLAKLPRVARLLRPPVRPADRQHARLRAGRPGRTVPGQVPAARPRSDPLRRAPRPGPLLASRIMDEAESIRVLLQEALYDMLRERQSVWFG